MLEVSITSNLHRIVLFVSDSGPNIQMYEGAGQNFRAKIIAHEKVDSARGDKMCQDMMGYLKARVKAAKVHKQKININISVEGIKIQDILSGVSGSDMYTNLTLCCFNTIF